MIERHGEPVQVTSKLTEEEIVKRKEAIRKLRAMARELKLSPSIEEIKSWINEGRRC